MVNWEHWRLCLLFSRGRAQKAECRVPQTVQLPPGLWSHWEGGTGIQPGQPLHVWLLCQLLNWGVATTWLNFICKSSPRTEAERQSHGSHYLIRAIQVTSQFSPWLGPSNKQRCRVRDSEKFQIYFFETEQGKKIARTTKRVYIWWHTKKIRKTDKGNSPTFTCEGKFTFTSPPVTCTWISLWHRGGGAGGRGRKRKR